MSGIQQLLLGGSVQQAVDPYFYSVTSLLHGDGTNGGQNNTFLDSSTNNFTITRNGNTTQGSFSPFSQTGWGVYQPSTASDYVNFTTSAGTLFQFTGDYTIETWVFSTVLGSDTSIWITNDGSANYHALNIDATNYNVYLNSGSPTSSISHGLQLNQWNHVAMVRNGSTITLYTNGVARGTITNSSTNGYSSPALARIGGGVAGSSRYLSNLRIVKGTAVYTAAFTPPTTPLTAISGTSLLTCQANRFLDASSNALVPTVTGSPSVQPFSPFNPTTPYSTSSIGGNGYFDGSGDYLTVGTSTAFSFGTGDFTIEFWAYKTSSANGVIVDGRAAATATPWSIAINGSAFPLFYDGATEHTSSIAVTLNAWNHVAIARSSGTLKIFVNGVQGFSSTVTTNLDRTAGLVIGARAALFDNLYLGYLSDLRIVKGTAVYTVAFTPPTAPLTAITNTSLLLNYTNGAIFDNAAVADYETVGNAQISTSVKKYGTGSMSFDGNGDYLYTPISQNLPFLFGGGDFTVEAWIYPSNVSGLKYIASVWGIVGQSDATFSSWVLRANSANLEVVLQSGATTTVITGSGPALTANTWQHVALCRVANVVKLYINGTQCASQAYSSTLNSPASAFVIGLQLSNNNTFIGYIDDLRISKGVARYPYNFTPPTAEFPNIGGTVTLTADPYFDYTTLLLPGNGTNGAQNNTFLDSSTNNFTITRNGNTTQGTFSPFSQTGWGNYFDGNGDYLQPTANSAFAFGTGNFTVECWIYVTDANDDGIYEGRSDGVTADGFTLTAFSSSVIRMYTSSALITASGLSYLNQWTHVALVCNAGTTTLYINGVSAGSTTTVTNCTNTNPVIGIGRYSASTAPTAASSLNGYISNFRAVKGTAVYTSNFTPSTTPLTAITNTSLLTCQSNRFIDNSTNAFAITRNGDVSVQAFSPFNPTAAWSASTNGGSGYFDGSGDYLTLPSSSNLAFGTGDFSVEAWVYPTSLASNGNIISNTTNSDTQFGLLFLNTGLLRLAGWNTAFVSSSTGAITVSQWQHVVACRSGTTASLFVNGVRVGTATVTNNFSSTDAFNVGRNPTPFDYFVGYISSLRILKGSSAYDATQSTLTVPTAPLTAITNTQALLSYTNAGIYDATSKNDLETVGNAQISTTQSKFGGSSMAFDGTDDRLPAPASVDIAIGTADFTIEGWFYTASPATNRGLFQISTTAGGLEAGNTNNLAVYCSSSVLGVYYASTFKAGTTSISANTWTHFALVRYSGSIKLYVNGIADGGFGTNADTQNYTGKNVCVGGYFSTSYLWSGYIQDFRITKGIARYTSNFTPPTTAFLTL